MTLMVVSLAMSLDAFSMGLALGTRMADVWRRLFFVLTVGVLHFVMPLIGMLFGSLVQHYLGPVALMVSAGILLVLGLHMVFQAGGFVSSANTPTDSASDQNRALPVIEQLGFWAMLSFACMISLDSLSVGVSMGMVGVNLWLSLVMFSCSAMCLCSLGLWLGAKLNHVRGGFAERAAGLILGALGVKFLYICLF